MIRLDLLLVSPVLHDVWDTRERLFWEGGRVTVVSKDGLIRMKSLRSSGQDRDDIERLEGSADEA